MADAFNMEALEKLLKGMQGTGSDDKTAKNQSKAQQDLAKLQGEIQKQLAEQQNQYQQAIQAQQAAAALEAQRQKEQYEKPFTEAQLTGTYNGAPTVQQQQLTQSGQQFQQTFGLQQAQQQLDSDIKNRAQQLAELTQQQQNAVATGQLELSRQIQTQTLALQQKQQDDQARLDRSKVSGYMETGDLTEDARAKRRQEALSQAQTMGFYQPSYAEVVPTGKVGGFDYNDERSFNEATRMATEAGTIAQPQMTDEAQKWRAQMGLDYAKTAAELSSHPEDYFKSAAYMRNAAGTGALGFLDDINKGGLGSSSGFRGTATSPTPATGSMASIAAGGQTGAPVTPGFAVDPAISAPGNMMYAGGTPGFVETARTGAVREGPSASLSQAGAVNDGTGQTYQSSMHVDATPDLPKFMATPTPVTPGYPAQSAEPSVVNAQSAVPGAVPDVAQQRLAAFQPMFMRGAQKLAPGALESMSPTEKALFTSAANASGINPDDFNQAYKRSHTFGGTEPVGTA